MIREIKYRAYHKTLKIELDVLVIDWLNELVDLEGGLIEQELKDVEILQYTGLKDKHSVKIYEWDALRDSESIVIVKLVDGEFRVDYRTMGGKWRNYGSLLDYLKDYEGEVIGNVYQNPELLEREGE